MLTAGADIENGEANQIRPLLMAVLNNHLDIARLLLAKGANPNADDFWGRSPLWAAVDYRNLDMNNRDQDSPIDNGVDRGPILDFVKTLIESGRRRQRRERARCHRAGDGCIRWEMSRGWISRDRRRF